MGVGVGARDGDGSQIVGGVEFPIDQAAARQRAVAFGALAVPGGHADVVVLIPLGEVAVGLDGGDLHSAARVGDGRA